MDIPFVDLAAQYAAERAELEPKIITALAGGHWVGGEQVDLFEQDLVKRCGIGHAVAVGSGTDALILSLRAVGIGAGDEVITAPNSFVSTAAAIVSVGARPVFADVLADQNIDPVAIEAAVTPRTRAVIPVHLTGRVGAMSQVLRIAQAHNLRVVEDAAQAFGSRLDGRLAGTFGDTGCFSAHPLKNLNACGDAGFVLTDDAEVAQHLCRLRNNGLQDRDTVLQWGTVSRLDAIQAAILRFRLQRFDALVAVRRRNAHRYRERLDPRLVYWPGQQPCGDDSAERFDTFHTFVVQVDDRDALKAWLAEHGIGTGVHYPTPLHLQPAAAELGYRAGDFPVAERQAGRILSLPIHQFLSEADVDRVVGTIHRFFGHE